MMKTSHLLSCIGVACLSVGCQGKSAAEIEPGTYKLSSASLGQSGRFRELSCTGDFQFSLKKKEEGHITLAGVGETKCAAENPASFEEILGGSCALNQVNFYASGEGETYIHYGSPLTCFASSNSRVQILIQPINSRVIQFIRRSTSETAIRSEILFERISDGL